MAEQFEVAIIGGGLCGLSLAIALTKRGVSYKIYESRASFREIGAGLNLGPNTLQAFSLIDSSLGDAVSALVTRNPPRKEDVFLQLRLGAPTKHHSDAHLITELKGGSMTAHRNDLLQALAERAGFEHAVFNKRFESLEQTPNGVTITFSDGTSAHASVAIACDGIHSDVRRFLLGADHPASNPHFSHTGGYRAMFPYPVLEAALGNEIARHSQMFVGPGGYVVMYPVQGEKMNIGLWPYKAEPWTHKEWILPSQREAMFEDMKDWGGTVHKIMGLIEDPTFWANFYFDIQPDSFAFGRVCLLGDAAHAMPPHQGSGAGQAIEDAYVMAEVLRKVNDSGCAASSEVDKAFAAYESVRRPRTDEVVRTSVEIHDWWGKVHREDLTEADLVEYAVATQERFRWIWEEDLASSARKALAAF